MPDATPRDVDRRVRVLLVNSTLHIGGAEQVFACLGQRLGSRLFDVMACYLKEPGLIAEQMLRAGVAIQPIPGLVLGRRDYLTSLKLRRLIASERIDVIHTHDLHGLIDGAVCRLSMPRLRHVHTFHFGNYPHQTAKHRAIEAALWRIPDAIVAVGHTQAAALRELYHIPERRLRMIWNGVEDTAPTEESSWNCDVPVPHGAPIIASISTFFPQKGLPDLLTTAALLRDSGERFALLIAGDGPLRNDLLEQCRMLRLSDNVHMLGWVPQAAKRLLPRSDIFVQSSLWEAMSVVVLEAMAAARPMVVTSVGDNPHVVIDGVTGLIVPPRDPPALAAALRRLLRDADLRNKLASAARARYEELFTAERMISSYQKLYLEITGNAPATSV